MKPILTGASVIAMMAGSAMAQVSAEDVWASEVALYEAMGLTVSGSPQRAGATLTLPEVGLDLVLPFDLGSAFYRFGPIVLTEGGDGSVSLTYGDGSRMTAAFSLVLVEEMEVFVSGEIDVAFETYVARATGTPGAILWDISADVMEMSLGSLRVEGELDLGAAEIDARVGLAGYRSEVETRHDAAGVSQSIEVEIAETVTDFSFVMDGVDSRSVSAAYDTASSGVIVLPAGGVDFLNIAPALRDGLTISLSATGGQTVTQNMTRVFGTVMSEDAQSIASLYQGFSLDAAGLSLGAFADGITVDFAGGEEMPFPVSAAIDRAGMGFTIPLLASEEPQDWGFDFGIEGLSVDEGIWSLIDPMASFPRDPATFVIDVSGTAVVSTDLTDVMGLEAAFEAAMMQGTFPVMPQSLTVNRAEIAALGATATGTADFFLPENPAMFEGIPLPVGQAGAVLTGLNGLIDRGEGLGLFSSEELMGFRLGLGFIGRVTGEDEITSQVEFGADGGISLNGMRIR